jgi:hypothetical protein
MAVECGSEPKQEAISAPNADPDKAYAEARDAARSQAGSACTSEVCPTPAENDCIYFETKLVGSTVYNPSTQKWTSTQTSSGKCECVSRERGKKQPCKIEIEQTVTAFDATRTAAADAARGKARTYAEQACLIGVCPQPPGAAAAPVCKYKETEIRGDSKFDEAVSLYSSTQTTIGKCACP